MEKIVSKASEPVIESNTEPELRETLPVAAAGEALIEGSQAAPVDFQKMVLETVQAIRQVAAAGDQLAAIAILPEWEDGFRAALAAIPDEVLPAQIRAQLPIEADENAQGVNLVTRTDLEIQFLAQHFGPRERGGNGLLPTMQEYLARHQSPVRVTPDYLRHLYLEEIKARLGPQIVSARATDLTQVPLLRR